MTGSDPAGVAQAVIGLARAGQFEQICDMFAAPLRPLAQPAALRAAWEAEIGRRGPVTAVGAAVSDPARPGGTVVRIPVTCSHGALAVVVSVAGGQLTGIQLAPASAAEPVAPWEPPGYADPQAFEEQEVTAGSGPLAVPGTLSLPRQPGPLPAVVLLAGSGPQDRDETLGRNKPLKDLAWGLATRGVAVLRFDKVTYAHPRQLAADRAFTVTSEYLPQAAGAIRLLQQHPAAGGGQIFVAGHSLGGTVAPRVAAAEPAVAGLIILAGGAQPLHWSMVRQLRYLASLESPAAPAAAAVAAATRQAELIDSPGLSPATPDGELPFGIPAAYWLDLRGYDPAAAAAALGKPLLILQGGRDYQATVADDLARWQDRLAGRPDVTIRVYQADNHLFFPGSGPPGPAGYEPPQHMDPQVVADIAGWLTAQRRAG